MTTLREHKNLPALILPGRTGDFWQTNITNAGALSVATPRLGPASSHYLAQQVLSPAMRSLVDSGGTAAYRVQVDDSVPSAPTVETVAIPIAQGRYPGIQGHALNGREFEMTVNAAGALTVTALTADWPVDGAPVVAGADGVVWTFKATEAGVMQLDNSPRNPEVRHRFVLRAQDNSKAWTINILAGGVVQVTDDGVSLEDTLFYEAAVFTPSGKPWYIQVDGNGIVSMFSVEDFNNARYRWPLIVVNNGKGFLNLDSRFSGRVIGLKGSYGWPRKAWRGGRA